MNRTKAFKSYCKLHYGQVPFILCSSGVLCLRKEEIRILKGCEPHLDLKFDLRFDAKYRYDRGWNEYNFIGDKSIGTQLRNSVTLAYMLEVKFNGGRSMDNTIYWIPEEDVSKYRIIEKDDHEAL